jgi:oxygen-independent coproporphyrinogen-3 oxidase
MTTLPTGLYIHFPWCVQKCPYCDFNSHPVRGQIPESDYIDRLLTDLDADLAATSIAGLETIFIGGGTPSLCSGTGISTLLNGVRERVGLAPGAEITLEANPGTVDRVHFSQYRDAGVNRLSIGAQSFDASQLIRLGRIHDAEDTERAMETARRAGFDNINIDLMHGLPDQKPEGACADLEVAFTLAPEHVSWYQLTIEPKTIFAERPPILPVDATLAEIEDRGLTLLADHGYQRYEVSAFAQAGRGSTHNQNYWAFGDYLGIGAGAHGKVSSQDGQCILRVEKPSQPRLYLRTPVPQLRSARPVPPAERAAEFMMNALRMTDGVEEELFNARTGLALSEVAEPLAELRANGLMQPRRLALTGLGMRHLDSVVQRFL